MNTFIRYVLTVGVLMGAGLLMKVAGDTSTLSTVEHAGVAIMGLLFAVGQIIVTKRGLDTFLDR